jgi:hypothetical protein
MAETKMIAFSMNEIAEILVKKQQIHEGFWGIYAKFGIGAANIEPRPLPEGAPPPTHNLLPAAIVPILELGIQKFDSPNSLAVDAAKVNPISKQKQKRDSAKRKKKTSAE